MVTVNGYVRCYHSGKLDEEDTGIHCTVFATYLSLQLIRNKKLKNKSIQTQSMPQMKGNPSYIWEARRLLTLKEHRTVLTRKCCIDTLSRLLCSCQEGMVFHQIHFPEPLAHYVSSNHYFASAIKKKHQVQSPSLKKERGTIIVLTFP